MHLNTCIPTLPLLLCLQATRETCRKEVEQSVKRFTDFIIEKQPWISCSRQMNHRKRYTEKKRNRKRYTVKEQRNRNRAGHWQENSPDRMFVLNVPPREYHVRAEVYCAFELWRTSARTHTQTQSARKAFIMQQPIKSSTKTVNHCHKSASSQHQHIPSTTKVTRQLKPPIHPLLFTQRCENCRHPSQHAINRTDNGEWLNVPKHRRHVSD